MLSFFPTAFMAILFLQSGIDKVLHYQGNQSYLTDFFKNSILSKWIGILMPVITILEVAAGVFCAIGAVLILAGQAITVAQIGMTLSAISILCLFFGQRMAKDYAGAASMTGYFVVALLGLFLLGSF